MSLPKVEGRITIPTGGYVITVTEDSATRTSNVTIPAGDYYWTTGADGGTALATTIKSQLDADSTLLGTYTVTISDDDSSATGKMTISVAGSASTFGISDWDQTGSDDTFRNLCGFTGTVSDGASATSQEHVEFMWLPNVRRSSFLSPDGDQGAEESDFVVTISPDGTSVRTGYARRFVDVLGFQYLLAKKVWISDESVANESLQKFWRDVIHPGKGVLYYKDRSDDGTSVEWVLTSGNSYRPTPDVPGWEGANSLWSWSSDVIGYV